MSMPRILAALFFLILAAGAPAQERADAARIVVTGEGVVTAPPDMATIRIGVTREARSAAQAMDAASAGAAAVLDRLQRSGIEPRDIQTTNVSLSPRFRNDGTGGPPRIAGYVASNDLAVRVRALDDLGRVLDAAVGDGANTMNGLVFGVADPAPFEDEARRMAVAAARGKAELLAAAAGVRLGPLAAIREGGAGPLPEPRLRAMAMEAAQAVPVAAGELDFRARVTLVYGIEDP